MTVKDISYKNEGIFGVRYDILICLFLTVSVLAVYWQVKEHDFVGFDDSTYITQNQYVQKGLSCESIRWAYSFRDKEKLYWHPLTWLSHMLDIELYGMNPGGHHLMNVLLHIINSLLLFGVFRRSAGAVWKSAFIAVLFALHPLNVESVAWAAERKNVLSTFFWMLCIFSYVSYSKNISFYNYILTVIIFLFGLLAKPMLVTLPFVLLLLDYWPLKRFDPQKKAAPQLLHLAVEKIPFFIASLLAVFFTLKSLQHYGVTAIPLPLMFRIENALVSYPLYIYKMVYPVSLSVFYPHPSEIPAWQSAGSGVILICISYFAIRLLNKKPYLAIGWLWYLGTLVPVIGLTRAGRWPAIADRWAYIPFIGIYIILAWGIPDLLARFRYRKIFFVSSAAMLIFLLMLTSYHQAAFWTDSATLYRRAVEVNPDNYVMQYNLAHVYSEQGQTDKAVFHYSEALRANPNDRDSHYNLGLIMNELKNPDQAVYHFSECLRIVPTDNNARGSLGLTLMKLNHINEAIRHFAEILKSEPENSIVHNNIGIALSINGDLKTAVRHFQEALRINPDYYDARKNLALALKLEMKQKEQNFRPAAELTNEN